jgi:mRNA interferase RelE/StbE
LAGLDKVQAGRMTDFSRECVARLKDLRSLGEALKGSKPGAF